jgi:hypothetical protein
MYSQTIKNKVMLEILQFHEERVRKMYSSIYPDWVNANGKTERKFKNQCKKRMDELVIQLRLLIKLQDEYKRAERMDELVIQLRLLIKLQDEYKRADLVK